jgi:hypothetical protein
MRKGFIASTVRKKKPRPTVARGTGRYTDLAFPDACEERRKRGGGA